MPIFPTQYSTLSAPHLGKAIQERYGLKDLHCRYLLRGVSDTYQLDGPGEQYILKIYRDAHRSLSEIKGEVELLNLLHAGGARVSYPIRDSKGEQIQRFQAAEGKRYGVLFSYAAGQPALHPTDTQLTATGLEMARLHNIAAGIKLSNPRRSYDHHTMLLQPLSRLKPAFRELPEEYAYLQETAAAVIRQLDSMDTSAFSYGYCHYDFLPKNFHFDAQDQLTFFDFDFAGKGWLVLDVMSYWIHFAMYCVLGRLTREEADRKFQVFLNAYRMVRPLSGAEEAAIPYLNLGFWVFYFGFHYDNFDDFSTSFFNSRFLKERVSLIKQINETFCVG